MICKTTTTTLGSHTVLWGDTVHMKYSRFVMVVTAEKAGPKVVSILVWNIKKKLMSGHLKPSDFAWAGEILHTHSQLLSVNSEILSGKKIPYFKRKDENTGSSPVPSLCHQQWPYPVSVFRSSDVCCATGETIVASVLVWAHNLGQHLLVMGSLLCGRRTQRELGLLCVFSWAHSPAALSLSIYPNSHKPGFSEARGEDKIRFLQIVPGWMFSIFKIYYCLLIRASFLSLHHFIRLKFSKSRIPQQ